MEQVILEQYWNAIPIEKKNAVSYAELCLEWGKSEREVRKILHDLSLYDNGDDYILIRSSANRNGFYRTDNRHEIEAYKQECLNKGRSIFAPVKKINRVLNADAEQMSIENNLRAYREKKRLTQYQVCMRLRCYDTLVDKSLLSKFENGVCLPTPYQLSKLAVIYGCKASDLLNIDICS